MSESRKILIKLFNKYTTFTKGQYDLAAAKFKELIIEYPNYKIIIGFINDHLKDRKHTADLNGINVWYISEDPLFKEIFGEEYYKKVQTTIEDCVFSFEEGEQK